MKDIKTKVINGRERVVDGYELFYEDENGNLQDADIHEPILAECNEKGAVQVSLQLAKELGLTRFIEHIRKYSPEYITED